MTDKAADFSAQSLRGLPSTLLIPLVARSKGMQWFPELDPHDEFATPVLDALQVEVNTYLSDWATVLNVLWRTDRIKAVGHHFFAQHPLGTGINLGCGLSKYFQWLDNGLNRWIDTDVAQVVAMRHFYFKSTLHQKDIGLDFKVKGWWRKLQLSTSQARGPLLIICEGVLMYLTHEEVNAVLEEIIEHAPSGSEIVFDFISPLGIGQAIFHQSVGPTGAQFTWGCSRAEDLTLRHPRLRVLSQRSVSEVYGLAGWVSECFTTPFLGGPLYGLAHFGIQERSA